MNEIIRNPWTRLRSFTNARLALGRAGDSLPTNEVLEFALAHAKARDAVHNTLDVESLAHDLKASGLPSIALQSSARDRAEYLRRPDLGRKLNSESRARLEETFMKETKNCHPERSKGPAFSTHLCHSEALSAAFIIADGLSSIAPQRHAIPVLRDIISKLGDQHIAPVIIATQARVAIGDEIGELLNAEMTIVLIGERPGLSSPDSLGIYLTYKPRVGCTDADRNCISNVRPQGLSYEAAARKLHHLMLAARRTGQSGIALKDESDRPSLTP